MLCVFQTVVALLVEVVYRTSVRHQPVSRDGQPVSKHNLPMHFVLGEIVKIHKIKSRVLGHSLCFVALRYSIEIVVLSGEIWFLSDCSVTPVCLSFLFWRHTLQLEVEDTVSACVPVLMSAASFHLSCSFTYCTSLFVYT